MSIDNLYKNIDILMFKECYALEKIHGTSAHIRWKDGEVWFFSGGERHENFVKLFNENILKERFTKLFDCDVVIYGEAYGGKCQGMSKTYGDKLQFVAFDVKVDGNWLDVPNAADVVRKMKLSFVYYNKIPTTLEAIDAERDSPSSQAFYNGCGRDKIAEGVVLRPLVEVVKNNGSRIMSKHKRDEFIETKTKREVDPEKLKILKEANEISEEWVTPNRLKNILSHLPKEDAIIENTGKIIKIFIDDIYREANDEIVKSKSADQSIGRAAAKLFKKHISKI